MRTCVFTLRISLVYLLLLGLGCGPAPRSERMPIPDIPGQPATSTTAPSLPQSAHIDFSGFRLSENIFRTQLNVSRLDDLYATTRDTVSNIAIISNCDLDVLKAFVANGWSPLVFVAFGKQQLWAISSYDDTSQEVHLENPISRIVRPLQYKEFERAWATGSGSKCALVTPGRLTEARVHTALAAYLPPQQATKVQVRSR